MSDPDIVTRLRGHIAITTRLHYAKDGYPEPVYVHGPSPICQEAADEIERLRAARTHQEYGIAYPEQHIQELVQTINTLRAERDEARRSVCEMSIQLGGVYRRVGGKVVEVTTPEGCAEIMRWDCFKENTNDR